MPDPPLPPSEAAAWLARNAVDSLPAGELRRKLEIAEKEGRPLRVKLGIDPTAPDIHLGHAVVLTKLREFQDLGHRVVLIIGDYTARVGDPSGRSTTRPILSGEEIDRNALTFQEQADLVLSADPERLEVRRNGEWLDMPMESLLRLARTTTVAQILQREDFSSRMAAQTPVSMLELLYPLLQGYDSVAVRADVELGGTDQTFNLLLAREIQRAYGVPEQAVLTMPLLVGTDGHQKMSKSLGNHIGLTEDPSEVYGKSMSIPDEAVAEYYRLLLSGREPPDDPYAAKQALAQGLVERLHGPAAAAEAARGWGRVFRDRELPEQIDEHVFAAPPDGGTVHLPAVIGDAFGSSRSEARRLIDQGGVSLDGEPVARGEHDLAAERLDGRVLRVGRRRFARLRRGEA
jgi:tyrosyl-tRNA synthetase